MPVTTRGTLTYHYEYLPFGWNFVKVKLYLVSLVTANRALERFLMKEKGVRSTAHLRIRNGSKMLIYEKD
jgi:hypothetical protein